MEQDLELTTREFFTDRFSEKELRNLLGDHPASEFFSWVSPSFRKLGVARDSLSDDELISMMLDQPRLIRRPLIRVDGELLDSMSGSDRIIEHLQSILT